VLASALRKKLFLSLVGPSFPLPPHSSSSHQPSGDAYKESAEQERASHHRRRQQIWKRGDPTVSREWNECWLRSCLVCALSFCLSVFCRLSVSLSLSLFSLSLSLEKTKQEKTTSLPSLPLPQIHNTGSGFFGAFAFGTVAVDSRGTRSPKPRGLLS
jgi:hypothetical protein